MFVKLQHTLLASLINMLTTMVFQTLFMLSIRVCPWTTLLSMRVWIKTGRSIIPQMVLKCKTNQESMLKSIIHMLHLLVSLQSPRIP
ncbi:hypothetical protein BKA65DRAFT_506258 [Rhexocercosporidium sp. MPI-PUGE-AT-0058]|nr:hypothetical protein BKA65DRAFT_506258 [Rhexocercosporidium sp. MPI-PUGE-AT-0058]